jgi:hypothetical protein
MLKGLLRIRRDQQETPHALQETDLRSRYRIGEAYSAFRGWRPIPAALPSHSIELVPGPKNSFQPAIPHLAEGRTTRGKSPDKTQSIKKLGRTVKLLSTPGSGKKCGKLESGTPTACRAGRAFGAGVDTDTPTPARHQVTLFNSISCWLPEASPSPNPQRSTG